MQPIYTTQNTTPAYQLNWSVSLFEVREAVLAESREMIIAAAVKKSWRLSRIGWLSNHIHISLGASMTESSATIALSLMNNLAFV